LKPIRPYKRTDRVANEIKEILGNIQTHQVDLSNLGFITFSKVIVSHDLKNAKVFFTVLNEKQSLNFIEIELNRKSKIFRKYLAGFLEIKFVPKLKFFYDDTLLHEQKINKLISKISDKDKY
tara:strand:+ start:408 stop:773 length:366 start_codon:yes stop_codon:yes gene_type:complete